MIYQKSSPHPAAFANFVRAASTLPFQGRVKRASGLQRVQSESHTGLLMEASMLELYHNNISVCAQKVRIVLAEKNVPWTNRHLSLAKGEQLTPEFKKMNPRGVVPVLVHDGNVIVEFERDLQLPRRGVPGPAAQPQESGGARHHAALVQAAGRHFAHGLRDGELCDLVRTAAQGADGRRSRGAPDEDAGPGAARAPARADREGHRHAVLQGSHQGVREDLQRDGGAA